MREAGTMWKTPKGAHVFSEVVFRRWANIVRDGSENGHAKWKTVGPKQFLLFASCDCPSCGASWCVCWVGNSEDLVKPSATPCDDSYEWSLSIPGETCVGCGLALDDMEATT